MIGIKHLCDAFTLLHDRFLENVLDKQLFMPVDQKYSFKQVEDYWSYIENSPDVATAAFRYIAFCRPGHKVTEADGETKIFKRAGSGFNVVYGCIIEDVIKEFTNFKLPEEKKKRISLFKASLPETMIDMYLPDPQEALETIKVDQEKKTPVASVSSSEASKPPKMVKKFAEVISDQQPTSPSIIRVQDPFAQIANTRNFITERSFDPIVIDMFEDIAKAHRVIYAIAGGMTGLESILDHDLVFRLANPLSQKIEIFGLKTIKCISQNILASAKSNTPSTIMDAHDLTKMLGRRIMEVPPVPRPTTLKKITMNVKGVEVNLEDTFNVFEALLIQLDRRDDAAIICQAVPHETRARAHALIALLGKQFHQ